MKPAALTALIVLGFAALSSPQNSAQPVPEKVDFARDVQPIFQRSCNGCHGAAQQLGGLRLDVKSAVLSGGVSGPALKANSAKESLIYQRVVGLGDQARMPMGGKALPPAQIQLLERWIAEGAEWPDGVGATLTSVKKHWSFVPPVRPALPAVSDAKWPRNAIDNFVMARLDKEGLKPSPEADRITLLRRASIDLTGLPPEPEDVDAFLEDKAPNAYERQIERLLASPHYGERWGRHWLDAARYADSDGYEKDKPRQVWFYRDWVIRALNRDLNYKQFLTEQLAGDLIPNATQDQIVATGFLRNSMINEEGGVDPEQFRMEAMYDRMDAIGKGMLGLTIQCAQCHNHKFDPIRQEDYYRLFAYLNNTHEANVAVYTPQEQMKRSSVYERIKDIELDLQHKSPDWRERMAAWEASLAPRQQWEVVTPEVDDISTGGSKYLIQKDNSMVAAGYAPTKHRAKISIRPKAKSIASFQLELLNEANLPMGGPGRSITGTGALTEFEVEVPVVGETKPSLLKIAKATADVNPPERELAKIFDDKSKKRRITGPIEFAIDGKEETAWTHDLGPVLRNQPARAVFNLATPIDNSDGKTAINVYLSQKHGGWNSDDNQNYNLGRVRLSVSGDREATVDPIPARVREILTVPAANRTEAQIQSVFRYWRSTHPEWADANATIAAIWREHPEGTTQLVLNAREEMRPTNLLERGDFLKPKQQVRPGVPGFLNPLPAGAGETRLDLANWLTDRQAPTTARSFVNRAWQNYFGTGIVESSEDLGRQTTAPSHPELLDYLAVEFMDQGWSMKQLHRMIVSSATYRQSSRVSPEGYAKDPANRLLSRGPRFRVEGEIVRDIALSASGLLNHAIGGPSVYPPAPEFLFLPPSSYGPKTWIEAPQSQDRYRRGLYTFRYRSIPYPVFANFDTPNGDVACVRRVRSNTPLQALTTLNEPFFLEIAKGLAERTLREGGPSDETKISYAFRRCVSRPPAAGELNELKAFLAKQQSRNADPMPSWTALARVLLNLDETITKE